MPTDATPKAAEEIVRTPTPMRGVSLRMALFVSLVLKVYVAYALGVAPRRARVVRVEDAEGHLVSVSRFHQGADFPYQTELFDRQSRLRERRYDRDENGWSERRIVPLLGMAGPYEENHPHFVEVDADQDGLVERSSLIVDGRAQVERYDSGGDGLAERVHKTSNHTELVDDNGDSFPDRFVCGTPEMGLVSTRLATCPPTRHE
jgi:hypothetical protein